jgi:hypothetical protein
MLCLEHDLSRIIKTCTVKFFQFGLFVTPLVYRHPVKLNQPIDLELAGLKYLFALLGAGLISFFLTSRVPVHLSNSGFAGEFFNHSTLLPTLEESGVTPYSLWYWGQLLIIGESRDQQLLLNASLLLVGFLAFAKGVVLTGVLVAFSMKPLPAFVLGSLLGVAVALPTAPFKRWSPLMGESTSYLGTLPPNVFMSATQLVANMFTVLAVISLCLWFVAPSKRRLVYMSIFSLMAVLAKPGIALPWVIAVAFLAFGMLFLRRLSVRDGFLLGLLAVLPHGLIMLIVYQQYMAGSGWLRSSTRLMPWEIWTSYTDQWFVDLLASWAFPIAVTVALVICRGIKDASFQLLIPAWLLALVAVLAFALLAEVDGLGNVSYSGNFAWGAMSATAGLYAVSAAATFGLPWRFKIVPFGLLGVQSIAGIKYINHYIATGRYF